MLSSKKYKLLFVQRATLGSAIGVHTWRQRISEH